MAYRHLVSLYLLTHLSKFRFVITSIDTISAIAAIIHQIVFKCSPNCSKEPSLWLISLNLRKAYIPRRYISKNIFVSLISAPHASDY